MRLSPTLALVRHVKPSRIAIFFIAVALCRASLGETRSHARGDVCEQLFTAAAIGVSQLDKILVSVETERAFMSAALAGERARALIIVDLDFDLRAVHYNRINKALLALVRDREDYLHLRLKAGFTEVHARLEKAEAVLSVENENVLNDAAAWAWWNKTVQTAEG